MTRAGRNDKSRIVEILSKSFDDNKSINYIIKQDKKRGQRIRALMAYSFEICYRFGDVFISENKKGCALLLNPEKKRTTVRTILWDIKLAFSALGLFNIIRAMKREAEIKKVHPDEKINYLWFIGVDVSSQGKGIGSDLMNNIIKQSSSQNRVICLETSTVKNLPWYEKFGFKTYRELDFGYTLYCMKRG